MKSEKTDKPKVTNRNIEKLLKELNPGYREETKLSGEYEEINKAYDALEKKLLDDPRLVRFRSKLDELRAGISKLVEEKRKSVTKIRKRYWAEGATPRVIESLTKLLDEEDRDA